jgi:ABC-type amino acid transport system permease subunit
LAVVTALLYLAMSWPLAILSRFFERRLERRSERSPG